MSHNFPIVASVATIQAVDFVPSNGYEIAKLIIQGIIALIGFLNHRKIIKNKQTPKN